jgi:hypothetical protein
MAKKPVKPKRKSRAKSVDKPKAGRPTIYSEDIEKRVTNYALLGLTNERIADLLGISVATFYNWCNTHKTFLEAISKGREDAHAEVAKSLYNRAIGYKHPDVDIRVVNGEIVQTPIVKHYPPETGAAAMILRNRHPELWKDKVDVAHSGEVTVNAVHERLADRLARLAASRDADSVSPEPDAGRTDGT